MIMQEQFEVSPKQIVFVEDERARNLKLCNNSSVIILYKIRTNNLKAVQATPNRGFINPGNTISLLIRAIETSEFDALLRITYATTQQSLGENFNIGWSAINKQQFKQTDVKVYRKNIKMGLSKKSKSIQEQNTDNYQNERLNSEEERLTEVRQKLERQKQTNLKLGQQLSVTVAKLNQINRERLQIKVNKSIGIICEDFHPSMTTFMLFLLTIFIVGFLVGKILG